MGLQRYDNLHSGLSMQVDARPEHRAAIYHESDLPPIAYRPGCTDDGCVMMPCILRGPLQPIC